MSDSDVNAIEYASRLLPFCDPNEPLLKACLDHIKGLKSAPGKKGADLRDSNPPTTFRLLPEQWLMIIYYRATCPGIE